MHLAVLEPYYGGSHRAFVDTFIRHSRHQCELLTMPARKWKWRMRGASIWFARQLRQGGTGRVDGGRGDAGQGQVAQTVHLPDAIFTCDMLSVADLRALLPPVFRSIPIICYFHENQLTYPLSPTDWRDYQYGMTNITSAIAADACWFNSSSHRDAFFAAAHSLLGQMPDYVALDSLDEAFARSAVHYPPVEQMTANRGSVDEGPPVLLWPHRWEYDKNPQAFFDALIELVDRDVDFRLIILGEQFRTAPAVFADAGRKLAHRVLHEGFVESREEYADLVTKSDFVISSAIQENFGIAVVEAMLCGSHPVLPNRLSYPELVPPALHQTCLYDEAGGLAQAIVNAFALTPVTRQKHVRAIQDWLNGICPPSLTVGKMDDELERVVGAGRAD